MGKVFKDKPISEITLRRFERPLNEDKDSLVRKFCISLGLLQPGDSRDVVVDILKLLLDARKEQEIFSSKDIESRIQASRKEGSAGSNIRRQILRLERIGLVEKFEGGYRIREFMDLSDLIDSYIKRFTINPIMERIQEYAKELDKKF